MYAPDECPRHAVRFSGHAAGVYHHHVGVGWQAFAKPGSPQTVTYRLAIGARRTTPEMFNVKLRHIFSLLRRRSFWAGIARPFEKA